MPVDRKIFKVPFHKGKQPQWLCPTCGKGVLKGKERSFVCKETKSSREWRDHIDWDPEWVKYVYTCQFICTNPGCGEIVFNIGTGSVDSETKYNDDYPEQAYFDLFRPTFFIPHLNIFHIPSETPNDIKASIGESFRLFFANPSSSANHLRIALEKLLDYFEVKRFELRGRKRHALGLHNRINLIPNKLSEFKELFFAIKWLGNEGSHSGSISVDDVMDAYDLFESVLEEIFAKKTKNTRKLAKRINRGKT